MLYSRLLQVRGFAVWDAELTVNEETGRIEISAASSRRSIIPKLAIAFNL